MKDTYTTPIQTERIAKAMGMKPSDLSNTCTFIDKDGIRYESPAFSMSELLDFCIALDIKVDVSSKAYSEPKACMDYLVNKILDKTSGLHLSGND